MKNKLGWVMILFFGLISIPGIIYKMWIWVAMLELAIIITLNKMSITNLEEEVRKLNKK